jgi:23S rRNA pseudouridine955/2504/2580 synthase
VAGDRRYGDFDFNRLARARWGLRRMFLHAWKLALPHPITGRPLDLAAPLPPELDDVLVRANLEPPAGAALAGRGRPRD